MERQRHLDYLRVVATFAVMVLHVAAQNWYASIPNSYEWRVFNAYDSLARWGAPAFVMISGALFLPRELTIKRIYSKYVLRLISAFIVWSSIYALVTISAGIDTFISRVIRGHYHMWFVWMIMGMYMSIPFIKQIIKDKAILKYYLILALVFTFLIPYCIILIQDFAPIRIVEKINVLNGNIANMNIHMVMGYVFYFILGYCLDKYELNKKSRIYIYILGICGACATILLEMAITIKTQTNCENYYGYFTVNVLLESIAIFVLFKYININNEKVYKVILLLSKNSFGAYMVHALIIEFLQYLGLDTLSFNPIIGVPVIAIIVFIISYIISIICNRLPIVRKIV